MSTNEPSDALFPEVVEDENERRRLNRERSNANLKKWQPGESGGGGRRAAGAVVKEWLNVFMHVNTETGEYWTKADIEDVVKHADCQPPAKVIAARQMLVMMKDPDRWVLSKTGELRLAGTDPEVGKAVDRVISHTDGKPVTTVINRDDRPQLSLDQMRAEINRMMANPIVFALVQQQLPSDDRRDIVDGDHEELA